MQLHSRSKKKGRDDDISDDINVSMSKKKDFKELGVTYTSLDPSDPSSFGYMQIGTIIGPHGVKGEVKLRTDTDFSQQRLAEGAILYVKKPSRRAPRPIEITSSRIIAGGSRSIGGTGTFLVKIKGISSRIGNDNKNTNNIICDEESFLQ